MNKIEATGYAISEMKCSEKTKSFLLSLNKKLKLYCVLPEKLEVPENFSKGSQVYVSGNLFGEWNKEEQKMSVAIWVHELKMMEEQETEKKKEIIAEIRNVVEKYLSSAEDVTGAYASPEEVCGELVFLHLGKKDELEKLSFSELQKIFIAAQNRLESVIKSEEE